MKELLQYFFVVKNIFFKKITKKHVMALKSITYIENTDIINSSFPYKIVST